MINEILRGSYPTIRMRRNRSKPFSRRLIKENQLSINDLISPLFVVAGQKISQEVKSMPGVFRYSTDLILKNVEKALQLGIPAVAIFPCIEESLKDSHGSEAINENNLICDTVKLIKSNFPEMGVICDVALDPYTTHGHDGLIINNEISNDLTIDILCKQAFIQAQAGCDIIAPSDMMDGRVFMIRKFLDSKGFSDTQIMSYAAKYASSYYGPFRDAVGSSVERSIIKDKRSYQMDPANGDEAIREVSLDISEGADMVMVKPGMPYLDILYRIKNEFKVPTFSYQVSGEYAMHVAAANSNSLDLDKIIIESLVCFKRAGADGVFTYFANKAASLIKQNS